VTRPKVRWQWVTVDFQPAPTGWRVLFSVEEHGASVPIDSAVPPTGLCSEVVSVAGWLVQVEQAYDRATETVAHVEGPEDRARRVVPGVCVDGDAFGYEVTAVDEYECSNVHFVTVLAPSQPDPEGDALNRLLVDAANRRRRHLAVVRAATDEAQQGSERPAG